VWSAVVVYTLFLLCQVGAELQQLLEQSVLVDTPREEQMHHQSLKKSDISSLLSSAIRSGCDLSASDEEVRKRQFHLTFAYINCVLLDTFFSTFDMFCRPSISGFSEAVVQLFVHFVIAALRSHAILSVFTGFVGVR
jgi:hypothetical protein